MARFKTIDRVKRNCNRCQKVTEHELNIKNKSVVKVVCKNCSNWNKKNFKMSDIIKLKTYSRFLDNLTQKYNTHSFRAIKNLLKSSGDHNVLKGVMI